MTLLNIIVGILVVITLLVFGLYSALAVRHASRFRYLSKRMLFLTLLFIFSSLSLAILQLISFGFFVLQS